MGNFRVTVHGVGGHGCQREKKDGEHVVGCERSNCPDCISREFVRRLKRAGVMLEGPGGDAGPLGATLEHWPGTSSQVTDDLITGTRSGSF